MSPRTDAMSWNCRLLVTCSAAVVLLILWPWPRCFWVLAAALLLTAVLTLWCPWHARRRQVTYRWLLLWSAGGVLGGLLFAWHFRRMVGRIHADDSGPRRPC